MHIGCAFDGGNILVQKIVGRRAELEIRKDHYSDYYQWFYFLCVTMPGEEHEFRILNAGKSSYTDGWKNYRAVASYDRKEWFRVPTTYDGDVLSFRLTPEFPVVHFAYFAPYTLERLADLLAEAQMHPQSGAEVLGETLDGRAIELLRIGEEGSEKPDCWIIARQHPGESMASWCAEGVIRALMENENLYKKATFYIVPNMNPDGTFRGHMRTNAAGLDLNKSWRDDTVERNPETFYVRKKMERTGVDFFLDIHGDEAIPYNFFSKPDGIPSLKPRQMELIKFFESRLNEISKDFQTEHGYPPDPPGEANLNVGAKYIAETYGCVAVTLEQPFKDAANNPDETAGWSPKRSVKLGKDVVKALEDLIPKLKS